LVPSSNTRLNQQNLTGDCKKFFDLRPLRALTALDLSLIRFLHIGGDFF
jgi:hypothetical protein